MINQIIDIAVVTFFNPHFNIERDVITRLSEYAYGIQLPLAYCINTWVFWSRSPQLARLLSGLEER